MNFDLPTPELLREQADWLAPARSRLLRQIGIAHRKRILDLGCGYGIVSEELARRGGGIVVGVDHHFSAFRSDDFSRSRGTTTEVVTTGFVAGEAQRLPFANHSFDLVFCQLALMWMPMEQTASEIHRVTMRGGVVVAIEPDYGGMLEWPEGVGLKEIWITALERAGADPFVGRKLPGVFSREGFEVRVEMTSGIQSPHSNRFKLLSGLPLTPNEQMKVDDVEKEAKAALPDWNPLVYLPFLLVVGTQSG